MRTWGLKFVFDGGPENGPLEHPYVNDPSYRGELNWDPAELEQVVTAALERGWRVGINAIGDRTVRTLLDIYERVLSTHPAVHQARSSLSTVFLPTGNSAPEPSVLAFG